MLIGARQKEAKFLMLGIEDLIKSGSIREDDGPGVALKKSHQVEIGAGEQRVEQYKLIWADLLEIAKKYINKGPAHQYA